MFNKINNILFFYLVSLLMSSNNYAVNNESSFIEFDNDRFNQKDFEESYYKNSIKRYNSYQSQLKKLLAKYDLPFMEDINEYIDKENKLTLLMYASDRNLIELVKALLSFGADPSIKDKRGNTALRYATNAKNNRIVNILQEHLKKINFNLIGFVKSADGIGQISLNWINVLLPIANIKLIKTRECDLADIPAHIKPILMSKKFLKKLRNPEKVVGIFTDLIWTPDIDNMQYMPSKSINFAYSMTEYTEVPADWVTKLNQYFDGVIVPDKFLVNVYKNSGVKIPVFSLPLAPNLNDLLNLPLKKQVSKPFTFGCSAVFCKRKNHMTLIEAFAKEFGNRKDVVLKLHGRYGDIEPIKEKIKEYNLSNVKIIYSSLTRDEYIKFISSLDAYVFISKGEGFSITPREALAAGIPCILSNNTTQKTICEADVVYPIPANIIEPAFIEAVNQFIGNDFNCEVDDVRKGLREVYSNYNFYLQVAQKGRKWVKQYLPCNLRNKYLNFINPKKLILGNDNIVTDNFLMTNSEELYKKYIALRK